MKNSNVIYHESKKIKYDENTIKELKELFKYVNNSFLKYIDTSITKYDFTCLLIKNYKQLFNGFIKSEPDVITYKEK